MRDDELYILLGLALMAAQGSSEEAQALGDQGWVWPLPELGATFAKLHGVHQRPQVTSGMGERRVRNGQAYGHAGVDIMYQRIAKVGARPRDGGSSGFLVPHGVQVRAARAGRIWTAGSQRTGYFVILDHGLVGGIPLATYYNHMTGLAVPTVSKWKNRNMIVVAPGQELGTCGADPTDQQGVVHLHFEIRRGMERLNPEPWINHWGLVR